MKKTSKLKEMENNFKHYIFYLKSFNGDTDFPLCTCDINTDKKTVTVNFDGFVVINGSFKSIIDTTTYYVGYNIFNTDFISEVLKIHCVTNIKKIFDYD